jgi:type VI secretion system protein ImpA
MAEPPILDLDSLLAPVPGSEPAGSPRVFFELRPQLEEMRREVLNPEDLPEDDPDRSKRADWPGLEKLTCDALQTRAKDLRIANYLVLALVRRRGFAGLRDGLRLLTELLQQCWDRLLPLIDEEAGPLDRVLPTENTLDDPMKGFRLPTILRMLPLVQGKEQSYSFLDWQEIQDPKRAGKPEHAEAAEAFEEALRATSWEWIGAESALIEQCLQEQGRLTAMLNDRVGRDAPGLLGLRSALEDCRRLARLVGEKTQSTRPAGEEKKDIPGDNQGSPTGPAGQAATRDEAYRQLAQAADTLQRLEPHSPIPYLVRRAVELGSLPFPQLIKALIRDGNVLNELNRELGLKESEVPAQES